MSKQDSLKTQNCILKVTIDCNGCAQKVKKRLKKIQGVNSVSVDAEQGKVVVTGDKVDPSKLIKKLKSSGMHAELLNGGGHQKDMNLSNQFQNNSTKGEKESKSKKVVHDFKIPQKDHKSVKFNLKEEKFDASDDGHDDLEDYSDDDEEEEAYGHGHGHAIPMKRNGVGPTGMMNGSNHKGNNGNVKNGHVNIIDPTMVIKGKSGNKNNNHAKKGYKVEKQNNKDQSDNENNEKVKYMVGGEGDGIKKKNAKSSGGGLLGRFLRFGKKSKKGANDTYNYKNINIKEEKEDDMKLEGGGKSKNDKGNNGKMGQMGPIGMNNPMDIRAVQKHPPMNGGGGYQHPQGVQMQMEPPSYDQQQQQQYMAMMMNQQHQQQQHHQQQYQQQGYMNNMYPQAMMYERQQPSMNYMPPPPPIPIHPMNDPVTHTFSDENVESCTIM